ncbi:hypothetical protein WR164_04070 [Philodulcilactobacillus myokoensis]|uniref:Bacteriocin n=1 Tax=Philodulcilactobacillus myokoensis TaxID=2929573 RepID=A0A9W6B0L2_9LACO|nr:bacteriocin [Philodulcilactobacillus myokoensis]GLB46428.1 hypothetical protein WR164_04070 [Philodulcilactobacillus myokoensis]
MKKLSKNELEKVNGGMKCYTLRCIRRRDNAYAAGLWFSFDSAN